MADLPRDLHVFEIHAPIRITLIKWRTMVPGRGRGGVNPSPEKLGNGGWSLRSTRFEVRGFGGFEKEVVGGATFAEEIFIFDLGGVDLSGGLQF